MRKKGQECKKHICNPPPGALNISKKKFSGESEESSLWLLTRSCGPKGLGKQARRREKG